MTALTEADAASKGPEKEAGFIDFANGPQWRGGEIISANVAASARGLAELGGYGANRGTF